jgi:4-coumarate--CoA ligase
MATIPSVKFPAQNTLVPLPVSSNTVFEFIFSCPFVKGSPTWKQTPKDLQGHYLPGPIPLEKPIFRDGVTGEL